MKSLFVAGYNSRGFGGAFIKKFSDRPFTHVSLVLLNGLDPLIEFESIQGAGVVEHEWTRREGVELFEVPASQDQIDTIIAEARSLVGCKYDWSGIMGFLTRRQSQNDDKWFCSEYVPHCCHEGGIMIQRMAHYKQTPGIVCASPVIIPFDMPKEWRVK